MAQDRRADAPDRDLERTPTGGRSPGASRRQRTAAALLNYGSRHRRLPDCAGKRWPLPTPTKRHGLTASQIAMTTIATTMAHQTRAATCFELPLRGESLAAWLNCLLY